METTDPTKFVAWITSDFTSTIVGRRKMAEFGKYGFTTRTVTEEELNAKWLSTKPKERVAGGMKGLHYFIKE